MAKRRYNNILIDLYWLKREITYRCGLDTPVGLLGILAVVFGLGFLFTLANGFAKVFQTMIPWVSGTHVGEIYWQSIGFGFKASFLLLLFCVTLIIFILLKYLQRP